MATSPRTPTVPRPIISGECSSITSPHDSLAWGQSQTGSNGSKGYFLQFEAPKAVLSARRKRSKSAGTRLSADTRLTAEATSDEPRTVDATAGSPRLTTLLGDHEVISPEAGSVSQPVRMSNRAQSRRTASIKRRKESDDDNGRPALRQQETVPYSSRSQGSVRSASDGKVAVQHRRHQDRKEPTRRTTALPLVPAASQAGLAIGSRSAVARRPSKKSPAPGPIVGSANGCRNVEQLLANVPTELHGDEPQIAVEGQASAGSCCANNDVTDDGLMPTDWDELADECSALAREMLDTRDSVTPTSSDGDTSDVGSCDSQVEAAANATAADAGSRHWWPPEDHVEEQQVIAMAAAAVTVEAASPTLPEHCDRNTSCPSFGGNDAFWHVSVCSDLRNDTLSDADHVEQPAADSLTVALGDSLDEERLQTAGEMLLPDCAVAQACLEHGDRNGREDALEVPPAVLQVLPQQQLCSATCTLDVNCIVATNDVFQTASACSTSTLTHVCCDQQLENNVLMTASDCPRHTQSAGGSCHEPVNMASADRASTPIVTRCSPMELEPGTVAELIEPFIAYSVQSVEENAAAAASSTSAVVCHSSSLGESAQEPFQTRSFSPVQMAVVEEANANEPASCVCTIERRDDLFRESSEIPLYKKAIPEADVGDALNLADKSNTALGTAMCRPEELDRLSTDGCSISLPTVVAGGCLQREDVATITTATASSLQSDAGSSTSSCETDSSAGAEAAAKQSNECIKYGEPDRQQFVPTSPRLSRRRKGRPFNMSRRIRDQEQRRTKPAVALLMAEAVAPAVETAVAGAVVGSQGSGRSSSEIRGEISEMIALHNATVAGTNVPEVVPESAIPVAAALRDRPDSTAVRSSAQAAYTEAARHGRVQEGEEEELVEIDPNGFGGQSDDGRTQMPILIHDNTKNNEPQGDRGDWANGRKDDRTSSETATTSASVAAEGGGLNGRMAAAKWISLLKEDLANDEWHSSSDSAPEDDQDGMTSKSLTQRTNFGCDARRGNEVGSSFDDDDWEEEQTFGETEKQARYEAHTTAAAKVIPDDEDAVEASGSAAHRKHTAAAARIRAHAEERRHVQMRGSSSSSDEEHDGSGSSGHAPAAHSSFGHPSAVAPTAASRRHAAEFSADTASVGCSQAKRHCNSTSTQVATDAHLSVDLSTLPDVPGNIRPHQPDGRRPYGEAMSDSESSSVSLSSDPTADRLAAQRPGSISLNSAGAASNRTLHPTVSDSSHLAMSSSSLTPRELPADNRQQHEQQAEVSQQQQQSRPLRGILKNSGARPVDLLREQSASHCDLSVLELLRNAAPLTSGTLSHAKSTPAMFDTATARSADQRADAAQLSDSDKSPVDASKAQPRKGAVSSSGSTTSNSAKELLQERLQGSIRDWRNMTAQSVEGKIFEWESTGDFRVHIKQSAPARKESNELGQILRRFASKAESSGQLPAGDEPAKTSLARSKSVPEVSAAQQQQQPQQHSSIHEVLAVQQQQQHSSIHEVSYNTTGLVPDRASTGNRPNETAEERLQANALEEPEEVTRQTVKPDRMSSSVGSRAAEHASAGFRVQLANGSAEPSSSGVYHARTLSSDWSDCGLDETSLYPQAEEQEVDVEDAFDEAPKHGQRPVELRERQQLDTSQSEEPQQDGNSQPQQSLRQREELDQRVAPVPERHGEVAQQEQRWTLEDISQRQLMPSQDELHPHERPLPDELLERAAVKQLLLDNAQQRPLWEQDGQQQQLCDDEQWHVQEQLRLQEHEQAHLQEHMQEQEQHLQWEQELLQRQEQANLQEQEQHLRWEQEQLRRQEQAKQEQLWEQEQQQQQEQAKQEQLWAQEQLQREERARQEQLWEQEQQRLWEVEQQRLWEQEQQQLWEQEQQRLWEQQQLWEQARQQDQTRQQELEQEQQQELRMLQEQEKHLEQVQQQRYLQEQERKLHDKWEQEELWVQTRQHQHELEVQLQGQDRQQHIWTDEQSAREQQQGQQQQWEGEQQDHEEQEQEQRWEDEEQQDQEGQEQWNDEQQREAEVEQKQEHDQCEQERRGPQSLAELAKPLQAHVPQVLLTENASQCDRQKPQGGFDIFESASKPSVSCEEEDYDSGSSDSGLIQPGVVRSLVSDGLLDAKVAEEMQPKDRRGDRSDFQTKQLGVDRLSDLNRRGFIETQQQQQQQTAGTTATVVAASGGRTDLRTTDSGLSNEEHCMAGESLPDETCDVYRDDLSVSQSSLSAEADEDEERILDESHTDLRPSALRKWPTGVNLLSSDDGTLGVRELDSSPSGSVMQDGTRLSVSTDPSIPATPAGSDILASSADRIAEHTSFPSLHSHPDAIGGSIGSWLRDSSKGNNAIFVMSSGIGNLPSNDDGCKGVLTADMKMDLGISDSPSPGTDSVCQTNLERGQGQSRPEASVSAADSICSKPSVSERLEAHDLIHSTLKLPIPATRHSLRRSREQPRESGPAASSNSVAVEAEATLDSTVSHRRRLRPLHDDERSTVNSGAFLVEKASAFTSAEDLSATDHYRTDGSLRSRDYSVGAGTGSLESRTVADEAAARCVSPSEPMQTAAERASDNRDCEAVVCLQATSAEATVPTDAFKFAAAAAAGDNASPALRDSEVTEVAANESVLRNTSKAVEPAARYRIVSPSILPANVSTSGNDDFLLQGTVTLQEQQSAGTVSSKTTSFLTSESALAARAQSAGTKYKVAEFVSQIEANSTKHEEAPGKSSLKSHRSATAKSDEMTGVHSDSTAQPPAGSHKVPSGMTPTAAAAAVAADVARMSNDAENSTIATKPFRDRLEAEWQGQVVSEERPSQWTTKLRQSSTTGASLPAQARAEHTGSSQQSDSVEELHRMTAVDAGDDGTSLAISRASVKHSSKPTLKQAADAAPSSKLSAARTTADAGSVPLQPGYGKRSSSYGTAIDSKESLDGQHKELRVDTSSEEVMVSAHVTSGAPLSRSSDAMQAKVYEAMSFSSQTSGGSKALGLYSRDGRYQPAAGMPAESGQLVSSARERQKMDDSKMQGRVAISGTLDSSSTTAALSSSAQTMPVDSLVNRVHRVRPQDGFASSSTSLTHSDSGVPGDALRADKSISASTDADVLLMHTHRDVRLSTPADVDRRVGAEAKQEGGKRDSGRTARVIESEPRLVRANADLVSSDTSVNSNGAAVVSSTGTKNTWTAVTAAPATTSATNVISHDQQSRLVATTVAAAPTIAKLETKETEPDRFYQHREQRKKMLLQRRRDFVLTCDTIEETHHDENASVSSADTDELVKARSVAVRQPSSSAYTDSDEEQVTTLRETGTVQPDLQSRANTLVTSSGISSILSARPFVKMSSPAITTFGVKVNAESRTPVTVPDRMQDEALRTMPATDAKAAAAGDSSNCQVYFARPAIVRTDDREERSSKPGDFDQLRAGSRAQSAIESVVTKQDSGSDVQASTQLKEVSAMRLTDSAAERWAAGAVSGSPWQAAKPSQHSQKTDGRKDETPSDAYATPVSRSENNATSVAARAAPAEPPLYRATVKRAEVSDVSSADYDYARVYKVPPMPKPSIASISSPTSDSYDFHFARPFTNPSPAQKVPPSAPTAADHSVQSKEANRESSVPRADTTSQYIKDAARMNVLTAISNRSSMNFAYNSNTGFGSASYADQGSKLLDGNSERGDGRISDSGHPASSVDSPVSRSTAGSTWTQQSGSPSHSSLAPHHAAQPQQSVRNQNQTGVSVYGATSANAQFRTVGSTLGSNKDFDSPRPTAPQAGATKPAAEPMARSSRSSEVRSKAGSGESTVRTLPPWERSKSLDRTTASRNRREQERKTDRETESSIRTRNVFRQQQQQVTIAAAPAAYKPLSSHDDNAYVELRYASSFAPRTTQYTISSPETPNRSGKAPKPAETAVKAFAITVPRGNSGSAEYGDRNNWRDPGTVAHVAAHARDGLEQQRTPAKPSHQPIDVGSAGQPAMPYRAVSGFETASNMPTGAMAIPEQRAALASRDASSHTEQRTTANRQALASGRYEATVDFDRLDPLAASAQQSLKRRPRASDEIAELEEMYARLEVAVDDLTRRQYMLESIDTVDVRVGRQSDSVAQPPGVGRSQWHGRERIDHTAYPTSSVPTSSSGKSTAPEQILSSRTPQRDQRVAAHVQYASPAVNAGSHRMTPTDGQQLVRRDDRLPAYAQISEPAFSQPPVPRRIVANSEAVGPQSQLVNAAAEYSPLRSLPQPYRQTHGRQQPEPQTYSRAEPARSELASTARPVALEQVPPRVGYVHPGPWPAAPMPVGVTANNTLAHGGARPDARTGVAPSPELTVSIKPAKGAAMLAELYAVRDRPNGSSGAAERGYSYQSLGRYPTESPARVSAAMPANARQEQAPPPSHGNATPLNPLWIRTDSNAEVPAHRDRPPPPLPASAFQANPFRGDRFSEPADSRRIQAGGGPASSAQLLMPVAVAPPREIWL